MNIFCFYSFRFVHTHFLIGRCLPKTLSNIIIESQTHTHNYASMHNSLTRHKNAFQTILYALSNVVLTDFIVAELTPFDVNLLMHSISTNINSVNDHEYSSFFSYNGILFETCLLCDPIQLAFLPILCNFQQTIIINLY